MAPIPKIKLQHDAAPAFDEAAIRAHCAILHKLADGLDGLIVSCVFFSNPDGDTDIPGEVSHHRVGDVDGMVEAVMAHAETPNANVFAGAQVMRKGIARGKRGKESDILAVLGLVVDLDADTGKAGDLPAEPNYVLETSTGNFQPFYLLDRPLPPEEAKPLAAALKRATGSDHGTADITHVWRIPGTLNWPNRKKLERGRDRAPVPVSVDLSWDGATTATGALQGALAQWWAAAPSAASVALGDVPTADGVTVSETAAEMLAACDVGDRSAWAAKVVEQLAFDGLEAEQAAAVFLGATGDWFRRYDNRDPLADFRRTWAKFGAQHAETRDHGARLAAAMSAKAMQAKPAAANDNTPIVKPSPLRRDVPPMHPDPFAPEAAGGLLEKVARWVNDTAIVPVTELSVVAALALFGGCFGKLALGPTNAGVNAYFCTMLSTAGGKGHPPKAIRALGDLCGAVGSVSNGDPTSYAAIERMLKKSISTVAVLDEFGILLQDVNGRHSSGASASIRKMLLQIFDQSNSLFDGRIYASSETKKDDSPLVGPSLTVLAATTPSTLYAGLSSASVSDGFINRFIFASGTRDDGGVRIPRLDVESRPPAELVREMQSAITGFPKPSVSAFTKPGEGVMKTKVHFEGGETGEAYKRWGEVFLWQHRPDWEPVYNDVNGRAAENTLRLATLRAISRNPKKPLVNLADVEWAWAIVYRSIELIATGIERHMAASPAEALRKIIKEILRGAKDNTIAYSELLRRKGVSGSDLKEVDGALSYLIESGEIDILGKPKPGRGSKFKLSVSATATATGSATAEREAA